MTLDRECTVRSVGPWWCVYGGDELVSTHRTYEAAKQHQVHLNAVRRKALAR